MNRLPLTDCKSSAWEKVRRLQRLGITAIMITVKTGAGEYHAITVVDSKWALDMRYRRVVTIDQLRRGGYQIAHLTGEP